MQQEMDNPSCAAPPPGEPNTPWEKHKGSLGAWRAELDGMEGENMCGYVGKEPLALKKMKSRKGLELLLEQKFGGQEGKPWGRGMAREHRSVPRGRGITLESDF